jgi:ankyrin repeat protein
MIECWVNVSFTITDGFRKTTMLHNAAKYGHLGLVKFLIERHAYIKAVESVHHRTPLMLAATEGKVDVVKYLTQKGANTKAFDSEGNSHTDNSTAWKIRHSKIVVKMKITS